MTTLTSPKNSKPTLPTDNPVISFLVFQLSGSHYAVPVTDVREIISSIELSEVPGSPGYLAGVANLRGRVLPIIDLRKKFRFESDSKTQRECFVVLSTLSDDGQMEFAIRVDAVCEVIKVCENQIDMAPAMTSFANNLVFYGVAHTPQGVRMILDTKSLVVQLQHDIQGLQARPLSSRFTHSFGSEFEPEA